MKNDENIKKIFNFLVDVGYTPQGAAGMTGNIYAESRCNPMCVEALLIQRYKEDHFLKWNYGNYDENSYKQYWEYVKTGAISENEFISPRSYTGKVHQYGAGICQWTTRGRKQKWLSLAKDDAKPLTDLGVQLNLLYYELKTTYSDVARVLHSSINVRICSNYVLHNFERPTNAKALEEERYKYSREIYEKYAKRSEVMMVGYTPDKVIKVAENEVGYLEKKSASNLDSKTGNAGMNNYTKYWRDIAPNYQGQAWCDLFVDWCMQKAYGVQAAKYLECGGYGVFYTPSSAQCYKDAGRYDHNPKRGDQVFFKNATRIHHTGIVEKVENGRIYTIEGNTSGASGVVANGGGIKKKSYALSDPHIAGYGHPRYDSDKTAQAAVQRTTGGNYMFVADTFKQGDKNTSVLLFQEIFNARNTAWGWKQKALSLDSDCGPATVTAVKWYQKQRKLTVDGICGKATWKDLLALKEA